jgi:CHAT domain-containing protein
VTTHIEAQLGWQPITVYPRAFKALLGDAWKALEQQEDGTRADVTDDLVRAWQRILNNPGFATASPGFRADIHHRYAIALQSQEAATETAEFCEQALQHLAEALRLVGRRDPRATAILANMAKTQLLMFRLAGDTSELEHALASANSADRLAATTGGIYAGHAASACAAVYSTRFHRSGDPADITRAVKSAEIAVRFGEDSASNLLDSYRSTLSQALMRRYDAYGAIDDVQRAIRLHESAMPVNALAKNTRDAELGQLLRVRWTVNGDLNDIDRAVCLLSRAVDDAPAPIPARDTNLGNALLNLYEVRHQPEDLDAAVAAHERALNATLHSDWQVAARYNNAGNSRRALFERYGRLADRELAVSHYRDAIALSTPGEPELASRLYNLGCTMGLPGPGEDQPGACKALRDSCRAGLVAGLEWALAASRAWGTLVAAKADWAQALEALQPGLDAIELLFRRQLTREEKETWLGRSQGIAGDAAFAAAMAARPVDAAVALERGRAYLLSEALEHDLADLHRLEHTGRGDLANEYRAASTELRAARDADATRAGRDRLNSALLEIRQVQGFEGFLDAPSWEEIASVARNDSPLVYLLAARWGGLAVIVRSAQDPPDLIPLPALDIREADLRTRALWRSHAERTVRPQAWAGTLDSVTAWLWRAVMGPLLDGLGPVDGALLVPNGQLGVLPLHAAWTTDASAPTGRRYVLDELTVSYAANARSLAAARRSICDVSAKRLLAVADPAPSSRGPVPAAEVEVATIARSFREPTILAGAAATRHRVFSTLAGFDIVHFACHGIAITHSPLDSGVYLAGDQLLTLRDLLAVANNQPHEGGHRLAVLSACEGSRQGDHLPDEVVSLPTGLLQAGFAGSVAPLWAVDGVDAALIMASMYEGIADSRFAPAALRAAQQWMRDTTNAEKATWLSDRALAAKGTQACGALQRLWRETIRKPPHARSCSGPQHWAGFTYHGI